MSFVVFQIFVNLRKIQVSVVTAVTGVDFGYWHLCCSKLPAAEGALLLQEPCCCRSPAIAGALLLQEPCCCKSPAVAGALLLRAALLLRTYYHWRHSCLNNLSCMMSQASRCCGCLALL